MSSIEPQNAITVRIFQPMPTGVRTLAEYQANVADRFGNGKLPSWSELAKRENAARWKRDAASNIARPQAVNATLKQGDSEQRRIASLRASLGAKSAMARQQVLATLGAPKTVNDVAREVGMSRFTVAGYLSEWLAAGKVAKTTVKRTSIWHRVQVAAE